MYVDPIFETDYH